MGWFVNYEDDDEVEQKAENILVELSDGTFEDRGSDEAQQSSGPLVKIDPGDHRPPTPSTKPLTETLYGKSWGKYKSKFRLGVMYSLPSIYKLMPDMRPRNVRTYMTIWWHMGYFEKWAAGKWGKDWQPYQKYHGVHYRRVK